MPFPCRPSDFLSIYVLCSLALCVDSNGQFNIVGRETYDGVGIYGTQIFNCADATFDGDDLFNQTYGHCTDNRTDEYSCTGLHTLWDLPSLWISGCGTDPVSERSSCPEDLTEYSTISNESDLRIMTENDCNEWLQTLPTDILLPGRGGDTSECELVYVNWSAAICAKLPGSRERIAIRAISAENPGEPGSERFEPYPGFYCGPYCAGQPDAQEYGNNNVEWRCANGQPLYTHLDRFQHAIECAMGTSTSNCCTTDSPTASPTLSPTLSPTTVAEGPWPAPSCITEDTCSASEFQVTLSAINSAYAVEEGTLGSAEDLVIYEDDDDYYYSRDDEECFCEDNSWRNRRQNQGSLRLGNRVVSFKPPVYDAKQKRGRRNHFTGKTKAPKQYSGNIRYIYDGEYNQYDAGNFISTSICGGDTAINSDNIPDSRDYLYYRIKDRCAVKTPCFGEDSTYRMRIGNGDGIDNIMHLRASVTTDDPEFFFVVSGNLGNDMHGNSQSFTLSSADGRYIGFAWQTCNGQSSDYQVSGSGSGSGGPRMTTMSTPSVNHLVIVKQGGSTYQEVVQHSPSREGLDGYYQAVKNITKGPLSYFLWYGDQDGIANTCWNKSSFQMVFDAAVTTTCSDFDCSNTRVCSSGCGETPASDNCTILGAPTPGPTAAPTPPPIFRFQTDSSTNNDSKSLKIGLGVGFGVLAVLLISGFIIYKVVHAPQKTLPQPAEPNNGFGSFNAPNGI